MINLIILLGVILSIDALINHLMRLGHRVLEIKISPKWQYFTNQVI